MRCTLESASGQESAAGVGTAYTNRYFASEEEALAWIPT